MFFEKQFSKVFPKFYKNSKNLIIKIWIIKIKIAQTLTIL